MSRLPGTSLSISSLQDITERKRFEKTLNEQRVSSCAT